MLIGLLVLTACSSNTSENHNTEKEVETSVEDKKEEPSVEEIVVIEQLEEPSGFMKEWVDYTHEEKLEKIEECLVYIDRKHEEEGSPTKAVGTPEDFVEALDTRYDYIQGLSESEKFLLNETSIAGQMSIMGNLFEAWYE